MKNGKDKVDVVLNKEPDDGGRRRSKAAANKGLITRNLRLAYEEVTSEGVPDRFLQILQKIDEREGER